MSTESPTDTAIRLGGGVTAVAKYLGESVQTVSNWKARGAIPPKHCAAVHRLSGVDRRELCPEWQHYWPELANG